MHIVGKIKTDGTRRVLLTMVFEKAPREVVVAFEPSSKKLFFREVVNDEERKIARKVDSKGRVCLPKWVTEELGKEFYVFVESITEHYVLPSKFLFVG